MAGWRRVVAGKVWYFDVRPAAIQPAVSRFDLVNRTNMRAQTLSARERLVNS